jgi:hypothetical protein
MPILYWRAVTVWFRQTENPRGKGERSAATDRRGGERNESAFAGFIVFFVGASAGFDRRQFAQYLQAQARPLAMLGASQARPLAMLGASLPRR